MLKSSSIFCLVKQLADILCLVTFTCEYTLLVIQSDFLDNVDTTFNVHDSWTTLCSMGLAQQFLGLTKFISNFGSNPGFKTSLCY